MEDLLLCESDFKLMDIIWENSPVESGRLVKLCEEQLNWKKSTTYTMLRKLCGKGLVQNNDTVVTYLVPRSKIQRQESRYLVERSFKGSIPAFMSAFLGKGKISQEEAKELMDLIADHTEKEKT